MKPNRSGWDGSLPSQPASPQQRSPQPEAEPTPQVPLPLGNEVPPTPEPSTESFGVPISPEVRREIEDELGLAPISQPATSQTSRSNSSPETKPETLKELLVEEQYVVPSSPPRSVPTPEPETMGLAVPKMYYPAQIDPSSQIGQVKKGNFKIKQSKQSDSSLKHFDLAPEQKPINKTKNTNKPVRKSLNYTFILVPVALLLTLLAVVALGLFVMNGGLNKIFGILEESTQTQMETSLYKGAQWSGPVPAGFIVTASSDTDVNPVWTVSRPNSAITGMPELRVILRAGDPFAASGDIDRNAIGLANELARDQATIAAEQKLQTLRLENPNWQTETVNLQITPTSIYTLHHLFLRPNDEIIDQQWIVSFPVSVQTTHHLRWAQSVPNSSWLIFNLTAFDEGGHWNASTIESYLQTFLQELDWGLPVIEE